MSRRLRGPRCLSGAGAVLLRMRDDSPGDARAGRLSGDEAAEQKGTGARR